MVLPELIPAIMAILIHGDRHNTVTRVLVKILEYGNEITIIGPWHVSYVSVGICFSFFPRLTPVTRDDLRLTNINVEGDLEGSILSRCPSSLIL